MFFISCYKYLKYKVNPKHYKIMSDISKCSNVSCPIRKKCYRFTAKSSTYQTFSEFKYDNGCKHYWNNLRKNK